MNSTEIDRQAFKTSSGGMRLGILLLASILLLLLTAVLPVSGGRDATAVYYSPVFMLLLGLLSCCLVWSCFKRRFGPKQIGFYLVHLGVVVLLAGALTGHLSGAKGALQLPLSAPEAAGGILSKKAPVSFGFSVSAKDFEASFYPPAYTLYRRLSPGSIMPDQPPVEKVADYETEGREVLDLKGFGQVKCAALWDESRSEWRPQLELNEDCFLYRTLQIPSHYGVTLKVVDGEKKHDLPIRINHPGNYKGWRFYLTGYDLDNQSFVTLSARHDPGRSAAISGIWMLMVGTFVLCFRHEEGC